MKISGKDRALIDALSRAEVQHRRTLLANLSENAVKAVRKHTKNLVDGRKKAYKLSDAHRSGIAAALKQNGHRRKLAKFVDGDKQVGGSLTLILSALLPLLSGLFK